MVEGKIEKEAGGIKQLFALYPNPFQSKGQLNNYMIKNKKVCYWSDKELLARLKKAAKKEGISEGEFTRRALEGRINPKVEENTKVQ